MYRKTVKNTRFKGIIYGIILLLQIALLTTVFVINHLTTKKAGVMRHIYSRRLQYEQSIFTQENLLRHNIVLIVLCILLAVLLILSIKKILKLFVKIQISIGLILNLCTIAVINSKFFIDMLAYPYFIIAFELALLIQAIVILIVLIINKK